MYDVIVGYVIMMIAIVSIIIGCIVEGRTERNDLHSQ